MKNEVSALMDGELDQHEAEQVIATLKDNESLREDWAVYHLIGDTIRQESTLSSQQTQNTHRASSTEPIPLNPPTSQHHNRKTAVYAIAASVTAAVITTWFTLQSVDQTGSDTNTMMARQESMTSQPLPTVSSIMAPGMNNTAPLLAHPLAPAEMNDYLFVHKEFLPGAVTHHPSSYVRPVINSSERYGR